MRIFKFGGASVKDANGIKNVFDVLQKVGYQDVLLIVSAMGKTTNALELVIKNYFDKSLDLNASVQEVKKYHNQILLDLFDDEKNEVFSAVNNHFQDFKSKKTNSSDYFILTEHDKFVIELQLKL